MLGAAVERARVLAAAKAHQERLDNDKKLCWKARALAVDQRALLYALGPQCNTVCKWDSL